MMGYVLYKDQDQRLKKIRKKMFSIFKDCKLKVTIEGNVTVTELLDVCFDLRKESFKPYKKTMRFLFISMPSQIILGL